MNKITTTIIWFTDKMVSLVILATIFVVLFFAMFEFYKLYTRFGNITSENVLHVVALTVVFVKAYRMLISYLQCHHVSVKYIVEISIIAPTVDLIFAWENRPIEINILFAAFSISMLIVYALFYKRIDSLDNACIRGERLAVERKLS
jgi:uncharacterized membrane protein (DUF373 family)